MTQKTVRLVKDGVGHYDAPESAVAFWEARGWKRADAPRQQTTEVRTTKATSKTTSEKGDS